MYSTIRHILRLRHVLIDQRRRFVSTFATAPERLAFYHSRLSHSAVLAATLTPGQQYCCCSSGYSPAGCSGPADEDASGAEAQVEAVWTDDGSLPLDTQGQLPFFLLDGHEEAATPGLVYLFGKVSTPCQAQHLLFTDAGASQPDLVGDNQSKGLTICANSYTAIWD